MEATMVSHEISLHQGHELLLALEKAGLTNGLARSVVENPGLAEDFVDWIHRFDNVGLPATNAVPEIDNLADVPLETGWEYKLLAALEKAGLKKWMAQLIIVKADWARALVAFLKRWRSDVAIAPKAHMESFVRQAIERDVPRTLADERSFENFSRPRVIISSYGTGIKFILIGIPMKADGQPLSWKEERSGTQPVSWKWQVAPLMPGYDLVEVAPLA